LIPFTSIFNGTFSSAEAISSSHLSFAAFKTVAGVIARAVIKDDCFKKFRLASL